MGGPEMAPQPPHRSSRPGGAVARLDLAPAHGGPEMAPQTHALDNSRFSYAMSDK